MNLKHFMPKREMIEINQPPTLGWCLCTTNSHTNKTSGMTTVYKHCLGCYICLNCPFCERPRQPFKKKTGFLPQPLQHNECPKYVVMAQKFNMNHALLQFIGERQKATAGREDFFICTIIHILLTKEKILIELLRHLQKLYMRHQRLDQSSLSWELQQENQ